MRTINEAYCAVQFLARYSPHSPFNCFLLGAGNSSIRVEATLDPFPRSRPYNTHQWLSAFSLSLSLFNCPRGVSLIRARSSSRPLRGHCSRCGRSIKGLDGNSQLNASPNGCEDLPVSPSAHRGVPLSSLARVHRNLNGGLIFQKTGEKIARPTTPLRTVQQRCGGSSEKRYNCD